MNLQSKTFILYPKQPYNLNLSLQRWRRNPIFHFDEDAVWRTIDINGTIHLIKIHFGEELNEEITVECICLRGEFEPEKVKETLERVLAVHCDLNPIYDYMNTVPELKSLPKTFNGLHIFLDPDPFESMIRLIIAQQINLSFATNLTQYLIEAVSETVTYNDRSFYVFPGPSQVAALQVDDLMQRKFSRRKAEYVIDFAKKVHEGVIDLTRFHHLPDQEVMNELVKIRGVGPWTVSCFMIFGLGRINCVPASDIGVLKGVQNAYGLQQRPTKEEIIHLAAEWPPIGSYITRYLWETLRV